MDKTKDLFRLLMKLSHYISDDSRVYYLSTKISPIIYQKTLSPRKDAIASFF